MYSSAINGDMTMIGNFVFDVFGMVWLDFGVPIWSGPFTVMEHEDVLDRTGLTTRVTFRADGSDPLGTQGRASVPKPKA
jgi:hypothetical protein